MEILDLVSFVERELGLINFALRDREEVENFVSTGNLPTRLNPRHQSNMERQRVVEAGHEDLGIEVSRVCDDPPAIEIRVHVPNAVVCPHYPFGFDLLGVLNDLLCKFSGPGFLQLVLALLVALPFNVIDDFPDFMLGLLRHKVPQLGFGKLRRYDAVIGVFGVGLVIHSAGIPRDQMRRESAASLAQSQADIPEAAHRRQLARGLSGDQTAGFHNKGAKHAGRDRRERPAH
ncbi:hypothetical protein D2V04_08300 [Pelagerythrobacter aerophilus]|uniref:Uncharacterized protein n=1 Tax=Pelagerythrobacter aerophilus TaxID=2306995 RepID=A0A418NIN1_9SPHN|nr:hypothetical protein D2V04_08300 [Pelagerythrobacter aerophilus]